ncbi:MAG: hypothetical protein E7Z73_07995 [Methanobrevibacter millerae]|uniref:Uncharacterized protein n=1 Tax=Methanobrevibacter millerae TaxID=230361 RepID=A0A8T3VEP6_9EURY|nr:hypothetical protein [Methanobrevibacter millerae]MBE6505662.1 hypothetical protein [Methanobrevibacter millerae]
MNKRQNIVLMFLIVMLSFAIISEVSAVALDDVETGESGLNGPDGSFNSAGPQIPSERLHKVSDGPVGDPHSNNQTSLNDVSYETDEHMNLYEQNHEKSHDSGIQDIGNKGDFSQGEKIHPDSRFDETAAPGFVDNRSCEVIGDITSELIGMDNISSAFKNDRKGNFNNLPFNGLLPPENISYDVVFNHFEFKEKVDLDNFNMDLPFENKTPNKLNSFLTHNKDIPIFENESARVNDAIPANSHLDFLPEINETQGFENTHFPNSNIHNSIPVWNSINRMKSDFNKLDLKHEGNFTPKLMEGLKL